MFRCIFLSLILFVTACATAPEEQCKIIEINDEAEQTNVTELIESIRYVVLQQPEDAYLTPVGVIVENDRIYSLDLYQRIFVHDINGLFLNILDRRGRGPGEYNSLSDFYVDDEYLYVLDGLMQKIFVYDNVSLQFIHDIHVPFRASDFVILDDGGFMFVKYPRQGINEQDEEKRYRVIVTDSDMIVRERHFGFEVDAYDAFAMQSIFVEKDKVYYASINEDAYYTFDKRTGNLLEKVKLKFDNPIPDKKRHDIAYVMESKHTALGSAPIVLGDQMLFICVSGLEASYYIYDGTSVRRHNDDAVSMFRFFGASGDEFVAYGTSQGYDQNVSRGLKSAEPEVEAQIHDDIPYLVFLRMKE